METSHYRREYAAYHAAAERARYEHFTGATTSARLEAISERYADLWTPDAVAALDEAREETPAQFETERAGLRALAGAARLAYAESRARELSEELSRCEHASRVEWGGEELTLREARARLAAETKADGRRELAARWLERVRACDDLRAARLASAGDAARELGVDSYAALLASATDADHEKLSAAADVVLERTAARYGSRLAAWAARSLPPERARAPVYADEPFFARRTDLDPPFPARELRATYEAAMRGAGVYTGRRDHLRVEESARAEGRGAACFALSPPEDVRLVFVARAGVDSYRDVFREAGHANQLAWASRDLSARYPEFVYPPDRASGVGYGFLLRALFADPAWLAEQRGVRPSEAEEIARACGLMEMYGARRDCARVRDEFELYAARDPRSESLAESCAARRLEATGFRQPTALVLFDLFGGRVTGAESLRGRLFAAALAEYLRTRHGARWWSRRAAGDELIDLWSTASRYGVEDLAPLAGAGALDPELLAASLIGASSEAG
ncbi:MAG TPA: hypothetical protein VM864_03095 [Pyrinomonadaceae bacterium]|jgi:hypothetical protein|nr:hypothetical protein [Pyrinomonadaceae bacterium]